MGRVRLKLNGLVEMPWAIIMNAINRQIFSDDLLPCHVKLAIRVIHASTAIITPFPLNDHSFAIGGQT